MKHSNKMIPAAAILLTTIGLAGCADDGAAGSKDNAMAMKETPAPEPKAAASESEVTPLKVGDKAPSATLRRPDGTPVALADLYASKPTVLIFYRGGWCPYCNVHLGQVAKAEAELLALGYQVVAISPDEPAALKKSIEKEKLAYQLLSDSELMLAKSFGLAFEVDENTVAKYKTYGIKLQQPADESHHLLPVPAVYIIDRDGEIQYAYWNADYKSRLDSKVLISEARRVAGK